MRPLPDAEPIVDEVAEERTDVKVGKVNVDEQPDLAAEFGVMSIPTLLLFETVSWFVRPSAHVPRAACWNCWAENKTARSRCTENAVRRLLFCACIISKRAFVKSFRLSVQTHRKIVS